MPSPTLLVASSDEHFREMVRDALLNIPNAKIAAEYQEVAPNLYIRVLQDLERTPGAGLVIDLSGDPETAIKAMERVKQAAPDLFVIASNFHADAETVISCMRAGANEFLLQPLKRTEFRDAMGRLERAPKTVVPGESKLGRIYLHRHEGRRRHDYHGCEFRRRAGAAQDFHGPDRSRLCRQRLRHAGRRVAAIHAHGSGRESGAHGPGAVRRLRHARSARLLPGRPPRFAGAARPLLRAYVSRVRHLPGGEVRRHRDRRRPRH